MIIIKSDSEIRQMRRAGEIAAGALQAAGSAVKPGITTLELDRVVKEFILSKGAKPSFLGYGGFPASACISVNEVVIHGIPGHQKLKEGDIVSVDVGAFYSGFHGDTAATFAVGRVADNAMALMDATKESLNLAHAIMKNGVRIGDIGHTIETYVKSRGFSPVTDFVGHGVGRDLHEDPSVPNFGKAGHGLRLYRGATVAVEPMINEGAPEVEISRKDGWTVTTRDRKLSAHFEHTFYIDNDCAHILTAC